jgi:hypothetical protein
MIFHLWERRHTADPTDRRRFKGAGGGSGEMRAMEEDRQQKIDLAVDAINRKFGIGSNVAAGKAPDRSAFMRVSGGGRQMMVDNVGDAQIERWVDTGPTTEQFDETGYNAALTDFNSRKAAADTDVEGARTARDAMYADISGAVKDTALRDLDRQYTSASRKNLFGLARAGLLGGSVDAEAGGELAELYGEGKLRATQLGQQAGSDLRSSDEKTRQNLISLAQSGLDTGTASSMAAGQMSAAADLAKSQASQASVGRLFDDLSQAYVANRVLQSRYPNGVPQAQLSTGYGQNLWGSGGYRGTVQR